MTHASAEPTRGVVRTSTLLRGLPDSIAEEILKSSSVETLRAGSVLFNQDETADYFFKVIDGWVKLERHQANGKSAILGVFTRDQSFAEAVAIVNGQYPATATAATAATVVRIPAQPLRDAIITRPEIGFAVIAATVHHLHQMIRQIEQLKLQNGDERVAEFLLSLTDVVEGPASIALPFDKQLIAGRLGIKPETLSRAFARLRDLGVEVSGPDVVIRDVLALQQQLRQGQIRAA